MFLFLALQGFHTRRSSSVVLFLLVLTAAAGRETSVWHSAAEVSRQVWGRLPSTSRPGGSGWANTTWHLPGCMIHRSGGASSGGLSSSLTSSGSHVGPLSCWSTLELRWHCGKPGRRALHHPLSEEGSHHKSAVEGLRSAEGRTDVC